MSKCCECIFICEHANDINLFEIALSAFLGFGSALLVEAIVSYIKNKNVREQLIKDVILELDTIQQTIVSLDNLKLYIQPYSIPVWNGACDSGAILMLDKKAYYTELLKTYASIAESNLFELKCFEIVTYNENKQSNNDLLDIVRNNRTQLLEQVTQCINTIRR